MQAMLDSLRDIITSQLFVSIHVMLIVANVMLLGTAYLIYLERKISAYIQDRIGPNRTGFDFGQPALAFLKGKFGLGQSLADGLKFLLKEDYTPSKVDKVLFTLAPVLIITPALIGFVVIPWGGMWEFPPVSEWALFDLPVIGWLLRSLWLEDLAVWALGDEPGGIIHVTGAYVNVGIIYLLAVASVGVYGITLGGWASNNKYSFLGGLRSTAQMISYEIPLGLSLLSVLLLTGTVMPQGIIDYQMEHGWLIFSQPIACVLFFTCALAEANRAPFDNAEAEQELVGGYHTEYSAMRFALFFLAEYAHMITSSAFFALLFLGGYHLPFIGLTDPASVTFTAAVVKCLVFAVKIALLISFMMVIRWTLPRIRYDQVMMLGWQSLIPIALAVVVMTSFMVYFGQTGLVPMLIANLVLVVIILLIEPMLRAWFGSPTKNRRIQLYGSRFSPMPGETVNTSPTNPIAIQDHPVESSRPIAG
ncbi:MAG: NADH-quinone oxidoreductase subunit H [Planctomycetota bacterium]|nr:MAG: NADH-quinone oxidoreductase subunit H [Planctomycetota bacterium]